MLFLKLWYHFCALINKAFYKIIYGKKLKFGRKVTWRKNISFMINKNAVVKIGDNCFFNNNCSINANEEIIIGNDCLFGENVKIYDHNHRFNKAFECISKHGFSNAPVVIGNNCWIGSGVVILKGTNIKDNCVIGAGCVVQGEIPSEMVVKKSESLIYEKIRWE